MKHLNTIQCTETRQKKSKHFAPLHNEISNDSHKFLNQRGLSMPLMQPLFVQQVAPFSSRLRWLQL